MLDNPFRVLRHVSLALLLLLPHFLTAQQLPSHHSPSPDKASVHGMLVFGIHQVYASHLPMFHSPHNYQVLLELELSDSARTAYQQSQQTFPAELVYTLEPEKFVLPEMVAHPRSFRAALYRGHFERGGTCIARNVTVRIKRVLYFQPLHPDGQSAAQAHFLLLGNKQEQYLIHRIERRPDFDQVVRVTAPVAARMRHALRRNGVVECILEGPNLGQPLTAHTAVRSTALKSRQSFSVLPGSVLYLEFDDLR
ncbi:hypothetical protein [Hymenobacter sp. BT730]|uniref:hypothetical protein n=1 Tax=Hymenobacter sp. BT730 TaxID=3063332 RepID=UPI0026DEA99C|nr:hypothetical protein [Hymenobacter sp. BT730]